ncbi:MAG: putative permease [Gammaproteobacteria bacterium]
MKQILRKIFLPLLKIFEAGEGSFSYKKSHRTILLVVGCLFWVLSISVVIAGISFDQMGAALPGLIFFAVGFTCLVVGALGTDRAVSKIWGSK